ncbi:hypothetical protein [Persicitalea jodogahamensis]|uniref:T9SS type A sorting domain-containing protein n=1 Tax=Persicitalea jodogahamensis TaxID=402147 RepID=A0A8J3D9F8_9BACT|nr:hypothetical protein [Persicitalea jodogahamensis]GHB72032.1 hypothetical protein GCM10007390_27560 [Persicitalea jodogahamensis]
MKNILILGFTTLFLFATEAEAQTTNRKDFHNLKELPNTTLRKLLRKSKPGAIHPDKSPGPTFEVGMYRIQKSLKMRLLLEKKPGKTVSVRLLDQQGHVLHDEVVGRQMHKYGRSFDFSQMEDGRYTLEISDGKELIQKDIKLNSAEVKETPKRTLVAENLEVAGDPEIRRQ